MRKALAVLAQLVIGVAGCGGSEQPTPTATVASETVPATTAMETAATDDTQTATAATSTTEVATMDETAGSAGGEPVIRVVNGQPKGGVATIEVKTGDTIRFVVRADAPEEVHVHGFDLSQDVGPGKVARFAFAAELEGVFEVELENSHVQIVRLVVSP